jgi:flagellar assembly protein FliH
MRFDGRESVSTVHLSSSVSIQAEDTEETPIQKVDHSACEARIDALQDDIRRLEARLAEETRAAYQQGFDAGVGQESAKWAGALARSAKAIAELAGHKPKMRSVVEEDAVRLSLAIAKKVLHREANIDPGAIAGLIRVALEKVNARELMRIRVSAQDAGELKSRIAEFGLPAQVELVADQSLERGGVVLDTEQGQIDASVDTQLGEIERGLADALHSSRRR